MGKIIRLLFPLLCLAATASAIGGDLAAGHEPSFPSQGVLFVTPLLSEAEEVEYRARIRTAKDQSERERIRATHYDLMRTRAKERGYDLPATRPAATGVTGEEFGPKLLGEEERAAQRAKLRAARIEASAAGPAPARPEPVVQLAKPVNAATVAETGKSKRREWPFLRPAHRLRCRLQFRRLPPPPNPPPRLAPRLRRRLRGGRQRSCCPESIRFSVSN